MDRGVIWRSGNANPHRSAFSVCLPWLTGVLGAVGPAWVMFAEDVATPSSDVASVTTPRAAVIESFRNDAALADVCFVDQSIGWAVGDRGVIWHTKDGGASWEQQESGVTCGLNAVCFINARQGWAAGGECRPYGNATRGAVLSTNDGGQNWNEVSGVVLPLLTRLKFFDATHGIAIGYSTASTPSGVFVTQDGGNRWQPLPGDRAGSWLAGDFLDLENGAVAGSAGSFASLARRQVVRSPLATSSLHSFHAMRLIAPSDGWLVGDGGVVMTTKDLGHSWQTPPGELPEAAVDHFDFHAVAAFGTHVWVGGVPGTRIFHSADGGGTWQAAPTGQSVPLRALTFVDAEHGWAVGDLGTILATHDSGRSWKLQRRGAQRVGLLATLADAAAVPLEMIADTGAADRYVTAVDILRASASTSEEDEAQAEERAREALLLAGAAAVETAWRFPLPADDLAPMSADILAALNRANDGRAIEQLERHLVRRLRMWRPDVVVTHHVSEESKEPKSVLLASLLMRSVEAAADAARYPELAADVGLPAWQVKKVYGILPASSRGTESVATNRYSPLLGTTLSDFASPSRHLLATDAARPLPDTYELELMMSQATDTDGGQGLFRGISSRTTAETRRPRVAVQVSDPADERRLAARRRHVRNLMEHSEVSAAWVGQIADLTEDLPADDGAGLLARLANAYRARGRLDLAADTYYLLARRYPSHPLTDPALIWLVQFYSSSEAGHLSAAAGMTDIRQTSFEESEPAEPAVSLSRDDRFRRAIQLTEYLRTSRQAVYAEPTVRFAEVAAQRQLGFSNPAKRYYLTLRQLPETDAWRQCAETEEWLAKPAELPPAKPFVTCRAIQEPPHLDALLDEVSWDIADRIRLRDGANNSRADQLAEIRLLYDGTHLYFAIRCPKAPGVDYRSDDRPRPRDADLTQHDRVTLRIDVDRDFGTAYEFTVDSRGWTHDACWGNVHWNPQWYVAMASDETSWTIEAAVPWSELSPEPPAARHAWTVAARRTIPRVGYQTWNGAPTAGTFAAEAGFLLFE